MTDQGSSTTRPVGYTRPARKRDWQRCLTCGWAWDDLNPESTVCACLDLDTTRTTVPTSAFMGRVRRWRRSWR